MSAMSDLAIDIEELILEGKSEFDVKTIMVNQFGIPTSKVHSWFDSVKDNMHYPEEDQNDGLEGWGEM